MIDRNYKDIPSLEYMFTQYTATRIRKMLDWQEALELSRLILGESSRTERQAVDKLKEFYLSNEDVVVEPPTCICPPPRERRWHKVDQGEAITWSHNPSRQPFVNAGVHLRRLFKNVESLCDIKFQETADRNGDIHITWDELDGAGGTLGVTYVPGTGDRMAACGPLCGDIIFDLGEDWTAGPFFDTVAEHEIGHALGLEHSTSRADLMYPYFIGLRSWQPNDIKELRDRYPYEQSNFTRTA